MKTHSLFVTVVSCLILFASCVSQKKYKAALTDGQALNAKNIELGNTITDLRSQITMLQNDNGKLVKQIDDAHEKSI